MAKFFKIKENSSDNNKVKKWFESDGARKNSRSQGETRKNTAHRNQKFKNKVKMKEVQCYGCQKYKHYARDC